jgi:hypothetical protein
MPTKDISNVIQAGLVSGKFRTGLLNQDTRMETIDNGFLNVNFSLDIYEEKVLKSLGNFDNMEGLSKALIEKIPELGKERRL